MLGDSVHFVIVNYNAGDWLQRSVRSALQTSASAVTVVDNDSSDHSIVTLKKALATLLDSRLAIVQNDQNLGFAAANNQVLEDLDSDFAVLLNPDCELPGDSLDLMLSAFEEHPQLGLASCKIVDEAGRTHKSSKRRFPTPWSALVRMLQLNRLQADSSKFADFDYASDTDHEFEFVEAVSGAFMVVRTAAMREVGLLDETYFMHCEDLDWCKRFVLKGWQVGYVGNASVVHAKGVSSTTRPIGVLWNLHTGMAKFFDKFYRSNTPLLLRWLVKFGIYVSFFTRALLSYVRSWFT